MPNPKLETYKNKATGTVYDFTDADAQSKVTATVDLLKDTTGWTGKNKAIFYGKGIYDLSTGVYTPLDPTNYGAWKKVSCKGGEKFVFVCNNAINQVIWYEWNGDTFISATPHSDLTSSYDEYTVGSNTTLVACVARLTGGNVTDDSDFGNPMIADAVAYYLSPTFEPNHESVEDILATKVDKEPITLSNTDDIDNIWAVGDDYCWGGSIPLHAPENHGYCTMRVLKATSTLFKQIIYYGQNIIYMREKNGNTINPWYKFEGTLVS